MGNILREIPNRGKPNYYQPEASGGGYPPPPMPASLMSVGGGGGASTGPQPLMGMGNPCNMGGNPGNATNTWLQLQTTTSITAPHEMCGALIGRGGSRISEIRNGSGAQITFSDKAVKQEDSKDDRIITISGTQQQVQRADQMITRFAATLQ